MIAISTYSGECDGLGYAAEMAGIEVAAYCEADKKRRAQLAKKHPEKPIFESDTELTKDAIESLGIRADILFGDRHASLFPSRDINGVQMILATDGPKCSVLYKNTGPVGFLLKTLVDSSVWRSTLYGLTWKQRVTKSGRLFCQLLPSVRPIAGIDVSSWPTPTAMDSSTEKMKSTQQNGTKHSLNLPAAVKLWPTPRARDKKGPGHRGEGGPDLGTATGGQLNPDWVECLMGFPVGWTNK